MSNTALEAAIEAAWEARDSITPATKGEARDAVEATLAALGAGTLRVAEKRGQDWHVNQWAKKAVLLGFRLRDDLARPALSEGDVAADAAGTCRPDNHTSACTACKRA